MAPRSRSKKVVSLQAQGHHHPDTRSVMPGAQVISSLITIAINAYLLNYITNLEKKNCECSEHGSAITLSISQWLLSFFQH